MLLQNINIGTRLTLGFGTVIIILVLLAFFGRNMLQEKHVQVLLVEHQFQQAEHVDNMSRQTILVMNYLLYSATTRKQNGFQLAEDTAADFHEDIRVLLESVYFNQNEVLTSLANAFDEYYEQGKEMAFVFLTEGSEEGALLVPNFEKSAATLTGKMKTLRNAEAKKAMEGIHNIALANEQLQQIILVAFGSIVALCLILATLATRSITRPLGKVVEGLSEIAAGGADLSQRLQVSGSDEVSMLATQFNLFTATLEGIIREFKENAILLQSTSQNLAGLSEDMASGSGTMAEKANQAAAATEEMTMNIRTLADSADNMNTDAGTVSSTAEEISQNMQTVAAAMEEMDAGMNSIAENARTGATIAGEAREKTEAVTEAMSLMDEASLEIGDVSAVIKQIADKTHLLALNATIEAASAGDAGLGFAVIAGEIKELARQSAEAAENIVSRIEGVKQSNAKAVNVVSDIAGTTEQIIEAVEIIDTSTEQQTLSTGEIAVSVHQVSTGIENIAASIANVSTGTAETSRVLAETSVSVQDLAGDIAGVNSSADQARDDADTVKITARELADISEKIDEIVAKFMVTDQNTYI